MDRYVFPVLLILFVSNYLFASSKMEDAIILNQEMEFLVDSMNNSEMTHSQKSTQILGDGEDQTLELEKIYFDKNFREQKKRSASSTQKKRRL